MATLAENNIRKLVPPPIGQTSPLVGVQSPDAVARNAPASLLPPPDLTGGLSDSGFNPNFVLPPNSPVTNIFAPGNPYEAGGVQYNAPIVGGIGRISDYLAGPKGILGVNPSDPFYALGPMGELLGPTRAAEVALGNIGGKLAEGAKGLFQGKVPQFATEAGGMARVDLGALGGYPEGENVAGGLVSRIGGKSQGVGAGADLSAEQMAAKADLAAQAAARAEAPTGRYVVDAGKTRSLIKDTQTGDTLPTIFMGDNHAADAAAEAARRNAMVATSENAARVAEAVIPQGHGLRDLTTPQLAALHEVTTDPQAKQSIAALLGERAFSQAPDAQLATALQQVPRDAATAVRRVLRTPAGDKITPGLMLGTPQFKSVVDTALDAAKVEKTPANRAALAQSLLDQERANNIRNLAVNAVRVKPTGIPPVDNANVALAHAGEDVKAGGSPAQAYSDATTAITDALKQADPNQLELPVSGGGGSGLPPMGPAVPSPGQPFNFKRTAGSLFQVATDLFQGTRNIASGDVSQIMSQTFPAAFKAPSAFVRGNWEGLRSLFRDDATFAQFNADLQKQVEMTGINVGGSKGQLFQRQVGTNIQQGEERFAGIQTIRNVVNDITDRIPALNVLLAPAKVGLKYLGQSEKEFVGGINAVSTYGYLSSVKGLEWLYRRPLTLVEKQGIADNWNILLGRGYNFKRAGVDNESLVALSKIVNGMGFSPQNSFARARIIPDTVATVARVMNDAAHGHAPNPADLDQIHGGGAFLASVLSTMAVAAKVMGVIPNLDSGNTNYLKIDLGKTSPELGKAVSVLEFAGLRTQTYNGHVYLDPGMGVGQDMRLLTQLVGPLFGHLPSDSKGHAWNPYDAKGNDPSAMELLLRFAENRLHPGASAAAGALEGHQMDWGDPTQNPVTSLLIPMFIQSGLQSSGLTQPGGPIRIPGMPNPTASEAEKQRLNVESPAIPELNNLSPDRQKQLMDSISQTQQGALAKLVASPDYQALTDTEKRDKYTKASSDASQTARKAFGLSVALNGASQESPSGLAIAFSASPNNYDRAKLIQLVDSAGKLTSDAIAKIDGQRKQTDPAKPNYDLSVADYQKGGQLTTAWLAAPAFIFGTKDQWTAAGRSADLLRKMVAEDERKGVKPSEDMQIDTFYNTAPFLSLYYTRNGSRQTKYVSDQRKAIEQNTLWPHFADGAAKAELPK